MGQSILPNSFAGAQAKDQIRIVGDGSKSDTPTIMLDSMPFLQISQATDRFSTVYDGFVGIAPYIKSDL